MHVLESSRMARLCGVSRSGCGVGEVAFAWVACAQGAAATKRGGARMHGFARHVRQRANGSGRAHSYCGYVVLRGLERLLSLAWIPQVLEMT